MKFERSKKDTYKLILEQKEAIQLATKLLSAADLLDVRLGNRKHYVKTSAFAPKDKKEMVHVSSCLSEGSALCLLVELEDLPLTDEQSCGIM